MPCRPTATTLALTLQALLTFAAGTAAAVAADVTFQADNWTAECAIGDGAVAGSSAGAGAAARTIDGDCSVTGVFQDIRVGSAEGSFALLVALRPPAVAVVGRPYPLSAELRIDANPPFTCSGTRYCVFAAADTNRIINELGRGSLILVDIAAAAGHSYQASFSAVGYRASLAKIRAEEQ
jgi:hypothetical protein